MRRREFIKVVAGLAVVLPFAVRAQQPERMRRIGVLLAATADDVEFQTWVGAFLQGLQQAGWSIGQNVRIDIRWATSNAAGIHKHAAELAALAPDVILAHGASTVGPLLQATRTVPIVSPVFGDPVGAGFVDSLARPGGNVTGFMSFEYGMAVKWLELLKETVPECDAGRSSSGPLSQGSGTSQFAAIQAVAPSLRVEIKPGQHARPRRIRARRRGLRALPEWRSDRERRARLRPVNRDLIVRASGALQVAASPRPRTHLRYCRRPDLL